MERIKERISFSISIVSDIVWTDIKRQKCPHNEWSRDQMFYNIWLTEKVDRWMDGWVDG